MRRDIALQEPRGRLTHRVLQGRWKRAREAAETRAEVIRRLQATVEAKTAQCSEVSARLEEARATIVRLQAQLAQSRAAVIALGERRGA